MLIAAANIADGADASQVVSSALGLPGAFSPSSVE
jgi:hypothetical protein